MTHHILFESIETARNTIAEGSTYTVLLLGSKHHLLRIKDSFYVYERNCPHSGHSLQSAKVNFKGELVCPSHAYAFRLENGQEVENRCRALKIKKCFIDSENRLAVEALN